MKTNKAKEKSSVITTFTIVFTVLCCLFMFNFYKCLSGFVANQFREPLVMIALISTYLLPVICFLYYFYDFYVGNTNRVANIIFSSVALIWASFNLALIFNNISVFASNNKLGVYDTLFGIGIKFPYDGIAIGVFLCAMQILNIVLACVPSCKLALGKESFKQYGIFNLKIYEFLPLCLFSILGFAFAGDAVNALTAIENALYDPKYIYLILWTLFVPFGNLLALVIKPETRIKCKKGKIIVLSSLIAINVLFVLLLWIFEATSPGFMIHIGKPLFPITFSVSMPIEMITFLSLGLLSTIIYTAKLVYYSVKKA